MGQLLELGRRIELVSMDRHFRDITIGLYERPGSDGAPEFTVHSYARLEGTGARLAFVTETMRVMGGLVGSPEAGGGYRFACGMHHRRAVQRLFLEACKVDPSTPPAMRPMSILDKKSGITVNAASEGGGAYRLSAAEDAAEAARRVGAITRGLIKLGEMTGGSTDDTASFDCGHAHDAIVGLLLPRALNVRASMREAEQAATRGVLAAPSAQQPA